MTEKNPEAIHSDQQLVRQYSAAFLTLAENTPDIIARYDKACRRLYVNPTLCKLTGLSPAGLIGKRPFDYAPATSSIGFEKALQEVFSTNKALEFDYVWLTHDGRSISSHFLFTPETDLSGNVASVLAIGRDMTALRESEQHLRQAERQARIGHWHWDFVRGESHASDEVLRIFGLPKDWKHSLQDILDMIVAEDRERVLSLLSEAFSRRQAEVSYKYRVQTAKGISHLHSRVSIEYGPDGIRRRLVGTTQDISELEQYESRLQQMAFRDTLTGLPNRALLNDRLQRSLTEASRRGHVLGLMVLDLDRFKEINDTHGHNIGDRLITSVAQRIKELLRGYDTVARLGGDEFAIVLPELKEAANLGRISHKIMDALVRPFRIDDLELFISTSIGISVFPSDGNSTDALFQYADSALNDAKMRGRACFRFYSSELTAKSKDRAALEYALRRAEPENQLELHYQPKIDLNTSELVGAEALIRWHHPELGMVTPDKFIGIAEDTGLIVSIGTWVLTKASLAAQRWNQNRNNPPLKVAVNLSAKQFRDDDLLATVRSILALTGCQPEWLELEITESLLLDDDAQVRATLQAFCDMGMTVAIDDFGTGYSALGYLKRFPIDVLKIDRSFTRDITLDRDSTELVKAIITMARSLQLELVAEGIETKAQEKFLQAHGCQLGQGYLFGKPMPEKDFEQFIAQSNALKAESLWTAEIASTPKFEAPN